MHRVVEMGSAVEAESGECQKGEAMAEMEKTAKRNLVVVDLDLTSAPLPWTVFFLLQARGVKPTEAKEGVEEGSLSTVRSLEISSTMVKDTVGEDLMLKEMVILVVY